MWDIIDYVELRVLNFRNVVCRNCVHVFGDDVPKSDPEGLRIVDAFTEHMLHRLCESAPLTVGIVPHC